jgi:hypothetical protein
MFPWKNRNYSEETGVDGKKILEYSSQHPVLKYPQSVFFP